MSLSGFTSAMSVFLSHMHVSGVLSSIFLLLTISESVNEVFVLLVNSIICTKHKLQLCLLYRTVEMRSFTCSSVGAPESTHIHCS